MRNNEFTYKGVRITKCQERSHKGRFFSYTADLWVTKENGTWFLSVRASSLDRIKDSINEELNRGAKVADGKLVR